MAQATGAWDPAQYARFRDERAQPFYDLAALVERRPGMRVLDLGCGSGELTAWLHRELQAAETLGIDAAAPMLAQARAHAGEGLRFEHADIAAFEPERPADLVFSNAALQWLEGHEALFARIAGWVAPGGQIAVQMPQNDDHPSHRVARALAAEPPYREALAGYERPFPVLAPEHYAALLHEFGFARQHVRLQVYAHLLPETRAVVEWVKGSLLTPYRERLPAEQYARFLVEYERRLVAEESDRAPYLYPFKRLLLWARRD